MNSLTSLVLDMQAPNLAVVAAGKQNDLMSRKIAATLRDGDMSFTPPGNASAFIRYAKPDGTGGFYDTMEDNTTPAYTVAGSVITFILCEQMLTVPGDVFVEINFYTADEKLTSFSFLLRVQASVLTDATIVSSDYYNVMTATLNEMAEIAANLPIPSTNTPLADSGAGVVGVEGNFARGDHRHPLNVPNSGAPEPLGTADNGAAGTYARSDHVHAMPGAADVGAVSTADVQYKMYNSVTDIGLTSGSATIAEAYADLPICSFLITSQGDFSSGELPSGFYGAVLLLKGINIYRGVIEARGDVASREDWRMFLTSGVPSGTWARLTPKLSTYSIAAASMPSVAANSTESITSSVNWPGDNAFIYVTYPGSTGLVVVNTFERDGKIRFTLRNVTSSAVTPSTLYFKVIEF